ncbi:LemA family protein [Amygdalobacter nucleatus]|uniref:LemA family protein n=1 Tax=Amygdalobacter nucleatus TaxID=3029274 RepID=A0A133YFQ4_9FIRM|nr:LemA family protein [Amygdalobacter nucleatus]KXB42021.1 LemA family protein [Amygdalobacter nucleatus]MDF0485678.1 LemA family protein [Amygdalobacter nucleatus]WEG36473.1 LemA family protein [Amygdalobacter nucleatus]
MKKKSALGVAIIVVLILVLTGTSYNSLLSKQINVEEKVANIDSQLQRRADLIPNLVGTVKGYVKHEDDVFKAVNEARTKLLAAKTMPEKAEASQTTQAALGRLLAVAENYPELKSDKLYTNLMDELAGTENRLAYARDEYNQAAKANNQAVSRFPSVIFARLFSFNKVDYFQATKAAQTAPTVDFSK